MDPSSYEIQAKVEDWHWWFAGRQTIILRLLEKHLNPKVVGQSQVLDIGCGTGKNLEVFQRLGWAIGIDESSQALSYCQKRSLSRIIQGSALSLPVSQKSFQLITMLDVLEHFDDDILALQECHRVLKPGGLLLTTVPAFPFLWGLQDKVSHHKRRYKKKELIEKIQKSGFKILRVTYFNIFLFLPILMGRLLLKIIPHRLPSENKITAPGINWFLKKIFSWEAYFLERFNLPFGVSLAVVARKS